MLDQFQRAVGQATERLDFLSSIQRWFYFIGLSILCYSLILLVADYGFAVSDMTEGLSYARWIADPNLYPQDVYIQSLAQSPVNERMVYGQLLAIGVEFLPEWCMFLHFVFSILLITGLYKWASIWVWTRFWRWACVICILLIGTRFSIGGNELYSNYLVPSLISSSIGVWALYFIFRKLWKWAFLLIFPMVCFQAIVGAQIALFAIAGFLVYVFSEKASRYCFLQILILVPSALWLFFIYLYLQMPVESMVVPADFRTFVLFRMPHHFLIQSAGMANLILSAGVVAAGLAFLFRFHKKLLWFPGLIITGVIVYISMLYFHLDIALKTQWLSTTTWLEAFSIILIFSWINQWISVKLPMYWVLLALNLLCLPLIFADVPPFANNKYQFFKRWQTGNAFQIANKALDVIPANALVAVPPDDVTFRFISGRSIFIDFKSIAHNQRYHKLWLERIEMVYGVRPGEVAGFDIVKVGMENYLNLETEDVIRFAEYGVTHWLTRKEQELRLPVLARNESYVLYRLYW